MMASLRDYSRLASFAYELSHVLHIQKNKWRQFTCGGQWKGVEAIWWKWFNRWVDAGCDCCGWRICEVLNSASSKGCLMEVTRRGGGGAGPSASNISPPLTAFWHQNWDCDGCRCTWDFRSGWLDAKKTSPPSSSSSATLLRSCRV